MIGLGTSITDVGEFNRRALIALRGVEWHSSWDKSVADEVRSTFVPGTALDELLQSNLYDVVYQNRRQISDQLVITYAAQRSDKA